MNLKSLKLCHILMQLTNISDLSVLAVSGFSPRSCHGGILIWNNGTLPYTTTLNISNIPYSDFTVQVYALDANHLPGVRKPACSSCLLAKKSRVSVWRTSAVFVPVSGMVDGWCA